MRLLIPCLLLTLATAMVASPLHRATRALRYDGHVDPPDNPHTHVVMVHGFLENGDDFDALCKRLHKRGIGSVVIRLTPSDARNGLESLSAQLHEQINNALGKDQRFSLVAFSMGGLVSRHYLQVQGGAQRCDQLITISTPHQGTHAARLYPGVGTSQMVPGSEFLQILAETEHRLGSMPLTSIYTPLDLVILPPSNSVWKAAENRSYLIPLHPMMLQSPMVLNNIEACLLPLDE